MDQNWMNNTTVIVTGASGGMGKGIAESLIVDHGCTVIGIARSEEKMKKVVEELGPNAEKFSYKLFDVSVEQNWIDFAKYLEDNDIHPDILVNNAGILPKFDRFEHYSMASERIKVLLRSLFLSLIPIVDDTITAPLVLNRKTIRAKFLKSCVLLCEKHIAAPFAHAARKLISNFH